MNQACQYLLGTHDFSCFEKTGGDNKTSICTVFEARWEPYLPSHVQIMGMEGGKTVPGACPPPDKCRGRGPLDTSPEGAQETVGGAGGSEATGVPPEGVSSASSYSASSTNTADEYRP